MMLALMIFILQATVAPKGSIEGIVIRSGTEIPQPLPNARVYLESAPGTGATVRTNSGGRFVLNDVAPGRYRFVVEKGGYARHNAQITMSPGQEMKDMVVPLTPAGTISGWVRTEKGEPIANAIVFASRLSYGARGEQMMTRQYHTRTNDLGEYRLFWLTPDEYFISATYTKDLMGPLFTAINPNEAPEPEGYVPIYYPGTAVAADAAAIKLEPGTEVEGIGFVMRRLPTLAVSGKTTNAVTGRPIAARLGLIPERDGGVRGSYQEQAADDGSFQFRGVTPGAYTLAASTIGNTGLSAFSRIEVRDSDMRDVNLALGPGLSLSGQITGEPLGGGSPLTFNRTQVILVPIDSSAPASASGFTKPDGSFTLTSVQ
ncbi:MAG: carboxypeptidase regulatory-like domain-containing protein, partial [Acidobacteria bacterium]|nr:carboxypeptidase regulatory-like domain-containing protein [Acidobacteriota bacterium]